MAVAAICVACVNVGVFGSFVALETPSAQRQDECSSLLASSGPIVAAALFDWPRITLGDVTELLSAFVGAIVEFFKSLFDW